MIDKKVLFLGISGEVQSELPYWPTRPSIADASEWPMSGMVPRKRGAKFFAADSRKISMTGLEVPVCLK